MPRGGILSWRRLWQLSGISNQSLLRAHAFDYSKLEGVLKSSQTSKVFVIYEKSWKFPSIINLSFKKLFVGDA